ncbi:MAG TPA: class I SAM-dependent methyltransferase [Thermoplasmata archaeon]
MALRKGLLLVREYETDWMGARHGPFGGVADRMKHESLALHGSETANRAIRRVISWAAIALGPYMTARISQELASRRGVDAWVQFAFDPKVAIRPVLFRVLFSLRPHQRPAEILQLLRLLAPERPRRVLEVGSAAGGTLFLFARASAPDALLIGMDLAPRHGGGLSNWRAAFFEKTFPLPPQIVRVVRGDSHDRATVARVRETLANEPLDFLFIDGDHSYNGVRLDFELYSPLVRTGGLIALHDIMPDSLHRCGRRTIADTGDVPRFWSELVGRHRTDHEIIEIVENPDQDGFGIGVLRA